MEINEMLNVTNLKSKKDLTYEDYILMSVYAYAEEKCPVLHYYIKTKVDTVKALKIIADFICYSDEEIQEFLRTIEESIKYGSEESKKDILEALEDKDKFYEIYYQYGF